MESFLERIFTLEFVLAVIFLIALIYYIRFLRSARRDAMSVMMTEPASPKTGFSDTELDRYARHIVLRELGGAGQQKLKSAKVLVIGAGGLGSPVLQYLSAAGVGCIGVIDDDVVSISNLQRQVLFGENDLGQPKVLAAQKRIKVLNPFVEFLPYNRRLTVEIAHDLISEYDLVLDGTDNYTTRKLVNQTCVNLGIPLISGAISQWEGQVTLFDPKTGTGCYACLFPIEPAEGLAPSCSEAGVIGPLPGIVGSIMAAEAVKWIAGAGQTLTGQMLVFDALWGESRKIKTQRAENCPVCSANSDLN